MNNENQHIQRVLVLNSPLFKLVNDKYDEDSLPPIGLGIIATSIQNDGHDVELIDSVADNIPLDELINLVAEYKPDYTCINVFSTNLLLVKELVESSNINTHWIIGSLATKDLKDLIFDWKTDNPIDIVHGDGEKIVLEIIGEPNQLIPNDSKENKRYFLVDSASPYYVQDISIEDLNRSFFKNEPIPHPFGFLEATIVTSRGCIYNCAFCAAARSVNGAMRTREKTAKSIIEEVQHLINIYPGLESIRVLDDLFLKGPKSIELAIEVFQDLPINWRAMAHVETFNNVDAEKVIQLKNSGCTELFIGLESGSPKILRQIHKTHVLEKIKRNVSLLLENGISVKGYFIYGFPNETQEDFQMTFELANYIFQVSLNSNAQFRTSVFQYRPYHGTELYRSIESQDLKSVHSIGYMEPNTKLSPEIGRLQFNFHNGNYSDESIELVHEYIVRTTFLDSLRIFDSEANPESHEKP